MSDSNRTPGGHWPPREKLLGLVLMATTALALYVCYRLALPFLPALTWALALAVVAHPLHERVERRLKRPSVAAGLSVAVVFIIIIAPGAWLTQQLVNEAGRGLETIKALTESGRWRAAVESNPQLARAMSWVEPHYDVRAVAGRAAESAGSYLAAFVGGSAWTLAQLLITFLTLFYLLRDRRHVLGAIRSLVPLSESETDRLFARVGDTVYATVYGTFVVSLIQGALGGLMFWWLGLPVPLFWGAVMTLLSLVPVLGAPVVWLPAAVFFALTGSWGKALILTGWGLLVIGTVDNLLYPVLVGDRLRMHALLIFFSVVGGLMLWGAAGLVLGPVAVVVTALLLEIWRRRASAGRAP